MVDVFFDDHVLVIDVAIQRHLLLGFFVDVNFSAHHQNVGLDADAAQFTDGLLRRFGLNFARGLDVGHERQMDEHAVAAADFVAELAHGFEHRRAFDVAYCPADFSDHHVYAGLRDFVDATLDFVRRVRHDLDRFAQVIAAAFLADHGRVDLTHGVVAVARNIVAGEALVMAQVEIGFRAVFGHVNFAMFVRVHGAGIDVQIRVELLQANGQAHAFQQQADCARRDALTQRRYDTAGYENMFSHCCAIFRENDSKSVRHA